MAMLNAQVTVIQKCYRGSRVMDWRNLRMNHIARHVYARRDFEQAQRALNRQKKFEAWQAELAKDSCSDSDGDAGGELGAEWVERRNLDGGLVWVHNETGEIVTVDPRTDPVDAELIGCSVRVFWPLEEQWFEGVLARFHRRRRKYRVEYIDGDHEWIDVDEAADRLQLYDASGSWSDFNVAVRPALAERQNKRAEKADIKVRARRLEEETRAWTVLPEKESGQKEEPVVDRVFLDTSKPVWSSEMMLSRSTSTLLETRAPEVDFERTESASELVPLEHDGLGVGGIRAITYALLGKEVPKPIGPYLALKKLAQ